VTVFYLLADSNHAAEPSARSIRAVRVFKVNLGLNCVGTVKNEREGHVEPRGVRRILVTWCLLCGDLWRGGYDSESNYVAMPLPMSPAWKLPSTSLPQGRYRAQRPGKIPLEREPRAGKGSRGSAAPGCLLLAPLVQRSALCAVALPLTMHVPPSQSRQNAAGCPLKIHDADQ
jgi:hypothetical protein